MKYDALAITWNISDKEWSTQQIKTKEKLNLNKNKLNLFSNINIKHE